MPESVCLAGTTPGSPGQISNPRPFLGCLCHARSQGSRPVWASGLTADCRGWQARDAIADRGQREHRLLIPAGRVLPLPPVHFGWPYGPHQPRHPLPQHLHTLDPHLRLNPPVPVGARTAGGSPGSARSTPDRLAPAGSATRSAMPRTQFRRPQGPAHEGDLIPPLMRPDEREQARRHRGRAGRRDPCRHPDAVLDGVGAWIAGGARRLRRRQAPRRRHGVVRLRRRLTRPAVQYNFLSSKALSLALRRLA